MDNTKNIRECENEFLEECFLADWKEDYGIVDEEYLFEEADDPRTWDDSLVPDFSKEITVKDYYDILVGLIKACGKTAYYFKMKKNFVRDANRGKDVALIYGHDYRYYCRKLSGWKSNAYKKLAFYKLAANRYGIRLKKDDKTLLNDLVEADRRAQYRRYVEGGKVKNEILSLDDMEFKYQELIEQRALKPAF